MKSFIHDIKFKKITVNIELERPDGNKELITLENAEMLFLVGKIGNSSITKIIANTPDLLNLVFNVESVLESVHQVLGKLRRDKC